MQECITYIYTVVIVVLYPNHVEFLLFTHFLPETRKLTKLPKICTNARVIEN